jgi:hypothetical protein
MTRCSLPIILQVSFARFVSSVHSARFLPMSANVTSLLPYATSETESDIACRIFSDSLCLGYVNTLTVFK